MKFEIKMNGLVAIGTQFPLDSYVQNNYSFCLPAGMEKASIIRKQEYIAGRFCAFEAAKNLGIELNSLPTATTREPIWPEGIVGSITHSKKIALSCLSQSDKFKSVGIDAEEIIGTGMSLDVAKLIATNEEFILLKCMNFEEGVTLLFSAKEALYKALFPLAKTFIDFKDVQLVDLDLVSSTFQLELISKSKNLKSLQGYYSGSFKKINDTYITVVSIPSSESSVC